MKLECGRLIGDLEREKLKPPVVAMQLISAEQFSGFELIAYQGDAFGIRVHDLQCADIVVGWDSPKRSLRNGDRMEAKVKTQGKSGNWYSEEKPVELHLALDRLTSPETPVIESAIAIEYWDAAGKHWATSCPIRYDKRIGNVEFLAPTVGRLLAELE